MYKVTLSPLTEEKKHSPAPRKSKSNCDAGFFYTNQALGSTSCGSATSPKSTVFCGVDNPAALQNNSISHDTTQDSDPTSAKMSIDFILNP